jgi:V8-like Glu-specific endopeptidase
VVDRQNPEEDRMTTKNTSTHHDLTSKDDYWTPERRANAKPDHHVHKPGAPKPHRAGKPHRTAPSHRGTRGSREERKMPQAFATYRVDDVTVAPYRAVGKLFYTMNNTDYVASGATVAANTIVTAAHCLFDFGSQRWAENMYFYPGYVDGQGPDGRFAVTRGFIMPSWQTSGNDAWDVAYGTATGAGTRCGWLGQEFNTDPTGKRFESTGYPNVTIPHYDFNGRYMWCSFGNYTGLCPDGTVAQGMECNFTPGCSGGPWLLQDEDYAIGVNSYTMATQPDTWYSPIFDDFVQDLFQDATR